MRSFSQGPLPPPLSTLVDTNIIHMIKWTKPFGLRILQAIKNWMVGRPENEAKIQKHLLLLAVCIENCDGWFVIAQ